MADYPQRTLNLIDAALAAAIFRSCLDRLDAADRDRLLSGLASTKG